MQSVSKNHIQLQDKRLRDVVRAAMLHDSRSIFGVLRFARSREVHAFCVVSVDRRVPQSFNEASLRQGCTARAVREIDLIITGKS